MQYTNVVWRNGRPYSERFDDIYYSAGTGPDNSGVGEFDHVFFKHNRLEQRWSNQQHFVIAELGLGSALNCLLTIREWLQHCDAINQEKTLHYIAIERYPLSPDAVRELLSSYEILKPYTGEFLQSYPPAVETTHVRRLFNNRVVIHFKFMDVMEALESTQLNVDAWYLDGFSPAKNPQMWSQALFNKVAENSHAGTSCSTYTAAGFVKRHLQSAGFTVEKVSGYGAKREMLTATLEPAGSWPENAAASEERIYRFTDKPWFKPPLQPVFSTKKATIIGSGIAGLSLAHALVKRGWRVTIIDKHEAVASEASANLAAIVYPRLSINSDIDTGFYIAAYCYALYFLTTLQQAVSTGKFWFDQGLLQLMDKTRVNRILEKYRLNEDFAALFDGARCVFKNNKKQSYLHYKKAGVVLPEKLCLALKSDCKENLKLIKAKVSTVQQEGKNWQCFSGEELINTAEVLIIANGSQLNNSPGLPVDFPVESVRGQMLELKTSPDAIPVDKTVNEQVYITPEISGYHYLGGTYRRNSQHTAIDENDTLSLLRSVGHIYPGLFDRESCNKAWAGIRSMSKDRNVIAGAVPDLAYFEEEYSDIADGNMKKLYRPAQYLPGLYVSAAHGSRGFTHGFLCADIIACQLNAEPVAVSDKVLDYLNPSRFIVNNLKRR